ncbi:fimbria/pilus outer membrane usher protein, partial [Salmonella enterica subsp. enterica serovar Kentucky]|nr:fimbria/pilus outer membrane usher protein [Salmonella enterica subsp. enterica serovar Kentucky]
DDYYSLAGGLGKNFGYIGAISIDVTQAKSKLANEENSEGQSYQGANAFQQLYFLFSFDAVRGNILHLSSNFTLLSAGKSLHYHW